MTAPSTLAVIAMSSGIALICLRSLLLRRMVNRYFWRLPGRYVKWTGMSLLLLILSGCGSSTTPSPTPTITPLVLTVISQPDPTPTVAPTVSTDWTTYHRDNQRTGYIANTPDPQSLTKSWQKQLDGAVYAEPLVV